MKIKYYYVSILFLVLAISIFLGDVGSRYTYYKNLMWFKYLGISTDSSRYPQLTLEDFIKTNQYINGISPLEMLVLTKKEAMINNAKLGETVGFLTENVNSQKNLMQRFSYGVLDLKSLIPDLKGRKIMAPYGNYNNNYLSQDDKLIYSDDVEVANLIYKTLQNLPEQNLSQPSIFVNNLTLNLKNHWIQMKKSGDYGKDGLSHGKRGYSKNTLMVLSELSPELSIQNEWYNKWPNRYGNNSIIRSFIIAADDRINDKEAFDLGDAQSYITHSESDIAVAAGAITSLFYKVLHTEKISKKEAIQYLRETIMSKSTSNSLALKDVDLGISLSNKSLDPILVYNFISGFTYNEMITLIVYSFLHFNKFEDALTNIVHTTGDNDSLSLVLGALFGAYDKRSVLPQYLNYIESKDLKLVN